jgi:hypothetical protein
MLKTNLDVNIDFTADDFTLVSDSTVIGRHKS